MLSLKRRVKKESFEKIIKDGVFLRTDNFFVRFLDKKDNLPSRFAFVVPIKVKKTSVGRHLIKRKMTTVVEKIIANSKKGLSCIIFARKDISSLPYIETEKEIVGLLKKTEILNESQF